MKRAQLLPLTIILITLFFTFKLHAQKELQDSLKKVVEASANDTSKVNTLIELAITYRSTDPVEMIEIAEEAKEISEEINFKKGLAQSYKWIGMGYSDQQLNIDAFRYWQESLNLFEEIGDRAGIANQLTNLGTIYNNEGDDEKALDVYLQALEIGREIDDKVRMLTASLNIGLIFQKKEATWDKALEYYFIALPLAEALDYSIGIGVALVNIGEVYLDQGEDSLAIEYFERSRTALEGSGYLPYTLMNIGKYYTKRGEYSKASDILDQALRLAEEKNDRLNMAESLIGMAENLVAQNNISEAIIVLKKAEVLAREFDYKEKLRDTYDMLAKYSAGARDYKTAFDYQKLLTDVKDSLFHNANEKRLNLQLTTFDLEQKQKEVELQELTIQKQRLAKNAFLVGLLMILAIAFIIFRNYLAKVKINKILDKQKEQIETLLLNILPKKVAKELQENGRATPRDYESVSVLFTDFKGFSSIAKTLDPNELVSELSSFFVAFDDIVERFNLEKIKTIGDAYMCAGGIPSPNDSHALDTVRAGLEMQKFMSENNKKREQEGKIPWELRVGIHTGPIVAGVVGRKKYAYDIWGSTVNIASRMESNGEAGKVNVSQTTYELIDNNFSFVHRGKIHAKNVGEIDMYFVEEN